MAIPAFVNPGGGSAGAAAEALRGDSEFTVHLTEPAELPAALRVAAAAGASRVLVAGGDGTLSRAAASLVGTPVALAVLPAGTLNHFAQYHGIPADAGEALALAREGVVRCVDVGYVNDELFLNTSSVGAYVRYVRTRDRLERVCGYWLASLLAGIRILATLRHQRVSLELSGTGRTYAAPLLFVGVGERTLALPGLGQPVPDGARALHVVIPRGRWEGRRFSRAYARLDRELPVESRELGLDHVLVDGFTLELRRTVTEIALDGEIKVAHVPLRYRLARDALQLVVPQGQTG
ncbi:MAG: NAD(+)/NADH kinase [Gemmatimonadales bacterium]|nr:NAD(+)/NADH kinase [Gemmatimonadales bacterium]